MVQAVWASLLCLSGTYGDLLDYVIFAVLIFYILTVAGIFVLRRTRPDAERPYRAFGYPVVPALYIVAAAAIAVDLLVLKPATPGPGSSSCCSGFLLLSLAILCLVKKSVILRSFLDFFLYIRTLHTISFHPIREESVGYCAHHVALRSLITFDRKE